MTTKKDILKAIKSNCYDCSGFDWKTVKGCVIPKYPLYPYRMGKDPEPSQKRSEGVKKFLSRRQLFSKIGGAGSNLGER